MGRMVEMDDRMDAKGYMRFCTREQTVRLLGNAISEEVAVLAQESGLQFDAAEQIRDAGRLRSKLAKVSWIRYLMQGVVNRLYRWLN